MKKLISFVSAMMLTVGLFNVNVMADVSQANEAASEICADEVGYGADGSDANADTKSLENNDTESGHIEPDNPEPVLQPMWNNDGTGHMYIQMRLVIELPAGRIQMVQYTIQMQMVMRPQVGSLLMAAGTI